MARGNSGGRKWDQYCKYVYGASSSCSSAWSCPQLPELPRRPWKDKASFYFSDFLQPVDTGAGLCYAQKSKDLEALASNTVRCVSWLAHTAWTGEDLFYFDFLPSRGLPKGTNSDLQFMRMGEKSFSCQPALHSPFSPSAPPPVWFLVGEGPWMAALGPLQVPFHLWYLILTIWLENKRKC